MTTTSTATTTAREAAPVVKTCAERTAAAVINGILRFNRRNNRGALVNAWTNEAGQTCATDAYRVICLPWRPAAVSEVETSDDETERAVTLQRVEHLAFDALDRGEVKPIDAPDLAALKAIVAARTYAVDLGDDLPTLNARYLYDVARVLPGASWYVQTGKGLYGMVYAVTETGARAVVLPMRFDKADAAKLTPATETETTTAEEPAEEPQQIAEETAAAAETTTETETATEEPAQEEPAAMAATEEPQQAAEPIKEPAPVALGNGWTVEASAEEEPQQATEPAPASAAEEPAADPSKPWAGSELRGAWWVIRFDAATARTRLTLSHEPSEKAAAYIAEAGFWASKTTPGTYTRKLTVKAYRAALALASNLSHFHR